jgi:hypothetical protein
LWRRAGIDAFMTKPVNVHELQYKLAKLQADLLRATSGDNTHSSDVNLRMEVMYLDCEWHKSNEF